MKWFVVIGASPLETLAEGEHEAEPFPRLREIGPHHRGLRRVEADADAERVLEMVEIEIGVMVSQCLDRRIPTKAKLTSEVKAWERRRNRERARIKWRFTVDRAREKLRRAYPPVAGRATRRTAA